MSGQNVATLAQTGSIAIVKDTDYLVNPGAITITKLPAVIPAGPEDVVTWTVTIENTGYGRVSNVVVTDVLGSGLQYVSGPLNVSIPTLAVGATYSFTVSAQVIACSNWRTWSRPRGCGGADPSHAAGRQGRH